MVSGDGGRPIDRVVWWCWLALLVAVPVTSFPLVEGTVGGETVSPLSLIPLLLLIPLYLVPFLLRRESSMPAEVKPLALFLVLAVVSSAASLALGIEPYKGQTVLERVVHGMATLAVGISFFLAALVIPRNEAKLAASLRALYLGAALSLFWAGIQASYVLSGIENVPWNLNQIHRLFSVRDLFRDRVTGLAYEPSWLGDQLVVLYLPLWVGSLIVGWSAFRKARNVPWVEAVLAIAGGAALVLAKSRISILAALAMAAAVLIWGVVRLTRATAGRLRRRFPSLPVAGGWWRWGVTPLVIAIVLLGLAALTLGLGSRFDWRIRRITTLPDQLQALRSQHPDELGFAIADRVAFAERLVYWRAGIVPFERYPLLGVGIGNTGFFFSEGLPPYAYRLTEIGQALDPGNLSFPNAKSLWVRLLSETGIVGTVAYLTWLTLTGAAAVYLARRATGLARAVGVAGLIAVPAWLLEGLSLDSFALPQGWLMLGLLTVTAWRHRSASRLPV